MEETQIKRSLDIFWNGRIVGRYDLLDDGSELFSYDGSYLESADAVPISHSLPLRADPYGKRQLRPFFAGLLPEESQRQRIAAYLVLAESDDFSMEQDDTGATIVTTDNVDDPEMQGVIDPFTLKLYED